MISRVAFSLAFWVSSFGRLAFPQIQRHGHCMLLVMMSK
jgi:hypothetical protein